jgi:IS4 transposase
VIADEEVVFLNANSRTSYPETLRRVTALVEVDGREQVMTFLTNHLEWSAWTVVELYGARWDIEVFFKEIKQTIQLTDFLGNNANAVRWQIWAGLLVHLLLRFLAWRSSWGHAFSRIAAVIRTSLWQRWDLIRLLRSYGTAPPAGGMSFGMKQAVFSGFT